MLLPRNMKGAVEARQQPPPDDGVNGTTVAVAVRCRCIHRTIGDLLTRMIGRCVGCYPCLTHIGILVVPENDTKTNLELAIYTYTILEAKMGKLETARTHIAKGWVQLETSGRSICAYSTFAQREQERKE